MPPATSGAWSPGPYEGLIAYGDFGEFEAFLDEAETKIFKVAQQNRRETYSATGDLMEEVLHNLEVRTAERRAVTGVPTGFQRLDELTAGLQRENLVIVAARPGGGKTSWAVNVAMHAALQHKIPVLIFSLEMSKYELMERMLAGEARIDSGKIKRGFDGYAAWAAAAAQATGAPFIDLNTLAADRFDALGQARTNELFNDNQHTKKAGARLNAAYAPGTPGRPRGRCSGAARRARGGIAGSSPHPSNG